MKSKIISNIIIVMIIIQNVGCYSYSQILKEDIQVIDDDDNVKITSLDDKIYLLSDVEIEKEIVRGTDKSVYPRKELNIPVEEIAKLEVEKSNSLLIFVTGAIVAVLVINTAPGIGIDLRNVGK